MIYLTGDVHGHISYHKLIKFNEANRTLTKSDYVIILGDFGLVWSLRGSKYFRAEQKILRTLTNLRFTILFVDGNHENFDRLNKYPEIDMFDSKVGQITKSIFHLKRGNVYSIDNQKFLSIGGAESIDRNNRTEHIDWWRAESITHSDMLKVDESLGRVNYKVDYVLSHASPLEFFKYYTVLKNLNIDTTPNTLQQVYEVTKFKKWYFGHLHVDYEVKDMYALYDRIVELKI